MKFYKFERLTEDDFRSVEYSFTKKYFQKFFENQKKIIISQPIKNQQCQQK
jgi:hypothetical protein